MRLHLVTAAFFGRNVVTDRGYSRWHTPDADVFSPQKWPRRHAATPLGEEGGGGGIDDLSAVWRKGQNR